MAEKDLCTTDEIAERLFVTKRTLHEWVKNGKIPPPFKIGRKNLWKKSVIEEYIESKRK
jgi:excisionase family DNA binding protein